MDKIILSDLKKNEKQTKFYLFLVVFFSFLYLFSFSSADAATYYVDSSLIDTNVASGIADCTTYNPSNYTCGSGSASAYTTLADVNAKTFSPGDKILFKKGDSWEGTLSVTSSGTSLSPITYGSYGTASDKPKIYGSVPITGWTLKTGSTNIYEAQFATDITQLFVDGKKMQVARSSPYPQIRRVGKLISNDSTIVPYSFSVATS